MKNTVNVKELWKRSNVYVHYGCNADDFDGDAFHEVRNISFSTKPFGGFWASPTRCGGRRIPFGWETFCRKAEYLPGKGLSRKFYFCVEAVNRVFRIKSIKDYQLLPQIYIAEDAVKKGREVGE